MKKIYIHINIIKQIKFKMIKILRAKYILWRKLPHMKFEMFKIIFLWRLIKIHFFLDVISADLKCVIDRV